MWAVVVALAIAMWMWTAASLHGVRWCFNKSDAALQMVYLVAITAVGAVALLLLPYLVLPGSVLSQGWTRELLEKTQLTTIIFLGAVAAVALLRAQAILLASTKSGLGVPVKHGPIKNRPIKSRPVKGRPVKKQP